MFSLFTHENCTVGQMLFLNKMTSAEKCHDRLPFCMTICSHIISITHNFLERFLFTVLIIFFWAGEKFLHKKIASTIAISLPTMSRNEDPTETLGDNLPDPPTVELAEDKNHDDVNPPNGNGTHGHIPSAEAPNNHAGDELTLEDGKS